MRGKFKFYLKFIILCHNFFSGTPYGLSYDIYEDYYDYELSDNDIDSDIMTPQFISQPLNMVSIVQGIRPLAN